MLGTLTAFQNTSLDLNLLLPIVEINSMDNAMDIINDGQKPLALYLFTSDQTLVDKLTQQTSLMNALCTLQF